MPTGPKRYNWIMYMHTPLGSFMLRRATSLKAAGKQLEAYDRNTGFHKALQVSGEYGCTATLYPYTEENWETAEEFRDSGCPFDYPSKIMGFGPRGGIRITNA